MQKQKNMVTNTAQEEVAPQLSLERIYPKEMNMNDPNDRESVEIHKARYKFASENLSGESILDMACGCGFGTAIMAKGHPEKQFTGIDVDPQAIEYAMSQYKLSNLKYICADATTWDGDRYDSIVSLETIEHLPHPDDFVKNIAALLNHKGRVVASVPVTPTCDGNPHHLHDFTVTSFNKLFSRIGLLKKLEFKQVQPWIYDGAFSSDDKGQSRSQGVANNVLRYYRKHPLALVSRIRSLLLNGRCNIYLSAVFE